MPDKPIIFSAPMVRALLDGRKTQTRRVIKNPAALDALAVFGPKFLALRGNRDLLPIRAIGGDRLYVREAFCPGLGYPAPITKPHYRADDDKPEWRGLWKPSIHMPRWASRLTLTVTEVRVQRLQDISEADAVAEGVGPLKPVPGRPDLLWVHGGGERYSAPNYAFRELWNTLHGPEAWDVNPWVVAYTFTVARGNIDHV